MTFTTSWSPNTPLTLKLVWDQIGEKFKFSVTDPFTLNTETRNLVYSGAVINAGPPTSFDFKSTRVDVFPANCAAGRKQAMIDVTFDNIKVKRSP